MFCRKLYRTMVIAVIFILALQLIACNHTYGDKHDPTTDLLPKDEESYFVMLSLPLEDQVYNANDPPPIFTWTLYKGLSESFIIEIDHLNDGSYITDKILGRTNYKVPQETWERIKNESPVIDGRQKIRWRIRIDYVIHPEEGPYYSAWGAFWIENE